jgi:hypothetical protein
VQVEHGAVPVGQFLYHLQVPRYMQFGTICHHVCFQ